MYKTEEGKKAYDKSAPKPAGKAFSNKEMDYHDALKEFMEDVHTDGSFCPEKWVISLYTFEEKIKQGETPRMALALARNRNEEGEFIE